MKRKFKKATVMTPIKDLKRGEDSLAHYNAVLMEDIHHEMKAVIEKVESSEERLGVKIDNVEKKLSGRMDVIEAAVTHHTKILNEHGKELAEIKADMVEVKSSIKSLDDKVTKRMDDHEHRITTLEKTVVLS